MKIIIVAIVLFPLLSVNAQDSVYSFLGWSDEFSINNLPVKVKLFDNKLQLYTDFNDIDTVHGLISVYLINNTDSLFRFSKNSINDLVLPEYKTTDNNWIRYQPFYFGWCFSPYGGGFDISEKMFVKLKVIYPLKGDHKIIRYKLYDYLSLTSNEGFGYVDSTKIKETFYDDISFGFSDISFLTRIAYGYLSENLDSNDVRILRKKAIRYIFINYSKDISWESLWHLYKSNNEYSDYIKRLLEENK